MEKVLSCRCVYFCDSGSYCDSEPVRVCTVMQGGEFSVCVCSMQRFSGLLPLKNGENLAQGLWKVLMLGGMDTMESLLGQRVRHQRAHWDKSLLGGVTLSWPLEPSRMGPEEVLPSFLA